MDVKPTYIVDMTEFGQEGEVVFAKPSLRKMAQLKNQIARVTKTSVSQMNAGQTNEENYGDIEILSILVYVKEAPFPTDLEGFYNYCDAMEEVKEGSSLELYMALRNMSREIDKRPSPLDASVQTETETSD